MLCLMRMLMHALVRLSACLTPRVLQPTSIRTYPRSALSHELCKQASPLCRHPSDPCTHVRRRSPCARRARSRSCAARGQPLHQVRAPVFLIPHAMNPYNAVVAAMVVLCPSFIHAPPVLQVLGALQTNSWLG